MKKRKKVSRRRKIRKNPVDVFTKEIVQEWVNKKGHLFRQRNGRLNIDDAIIAMTKDFGRQKNMTDKEFTMIYSKMIDNMWLPGQREMMIAKQQTITPHEMFDEGYGKIIGTRTQPVMYGSDLGYRPPLKYTRKNPRIKKRKSTK